MPDRMTDRDGPARSADRSRSALARAWIERFVLPLPRGGRLLDLGCGGGEPIARHLIDRGFAVTGIDHSETMIDLAQTRFPHHRWLVADMRTFQTDEHFDGVLAWNSLCTLPPEEQEAMIGRAACWLKPGGRLLFNSNTVRGAPSSPDSLAPVAIRVAFLQAGLVEIAHVASDPDCDGAAVWLARKI